MGFKCLIPFCKRGYNDKYSPIKLHRFPKDEEIRTLWMNKCSISNVLDSYRICSNHFKPQDYLMNGRLYPSAVPSVNLDDMFNIKTNSCKRKLPFDISNIEKGIEIDQNLRVPISKSHVDLVSEQIFLKLPQNLNTHDKLMILKLIISLHQEELDNVKCCQMSPFDNPTKMTISSLTMSKNESINHEEPIPEIPHRNTEVNVSPTSMPKKRPKYSFKNKKPIEATIVQITTNGREKLTEVTESLDCMSSDNDAISPIHSPLNSPLTQKIIETCYLCSSVSLTNLFDCAICFSKAHKYCLIVDEPIWKYKLDFGPWFCKECRKRYCHKCLNNESQSKLDCRCITCEVGLHTNCYEAYDIEPMQKLETDEYVCNPCITLATQINSEEEEESENDDIEDDVEPKPSTSSII